MDGGIFGRQIPDLNQNEAATGCCYKVCNAKKPGRVETPQTFSIILPNTIYCCKERFKQK